MKQRSVKGLPKSSNTEHAWQKGGASSRERQCKLECGALHKGGSQANDRENLATEKKQRRDSDQTRRAEAFPSISGKTSPDLCSGRKHATAGDVCRVEEIGLKAS